MESVRQLWDVLVQHFRFADALDLAAGTILLTLVFHWLRNRSARIVIVVICFTAAFYLLANALHMYLMMAAFRMGLLLILFALIVVFQDDIRTGFERLTTWPPYPFGKKKRDTLSVETLSHAIEMLAQESTGALIVLPVRQSLDRLLQGGQVVNGRLSVPLLHSIFHSGSQGHDGAVIVQDNRVWKFGVHLPLSTNFEVLGSRGTRHAAALGLAERSDALVIVVSEERGEISIAKNRKLITLDHPSELYEILENADDDKRAESFSKYYIRQGARSLALASIAFLISGFFWYLVANRVEQVQRIVDSVPIETYRLKPDWVVDSIQPERVQINLAGSERAFEAFNWNDLKIRLDLSELEEGDQRIVLSEASVELPPEMQIQEIQPNVIRVTAHQMELVSLPVAVQTTGPLPEGLDREDLVPMPGHVTVRVPVRQLSKIDAIPTEPVELDEVPTSPLDNIKLVLPDDVVFTESTPPAVRVGIRSQAADDGEPSQPMQE